MVYWGVPCHVYCSAQWFLWGSHAIGGRSPTQCKMRTCKGSWMWLSIGIRNFEFSKHPKIMFNDFEKRTRVLVVWLLLWVIVPSCFFWLVWLMTWDFPSTKQICMWIIYRNLNTAQFPSIPIRVVSESRGKLDHSIVSCQILIETSERSDMNLFTGDKHVKSLIIHWRHWRLDPWSRSWSIFFSSTSVCWQNQPDWGTEYVYWFAGCRHGVRLFLGP